MPAVGFHSGGSPNVSAWLACPQRAASFSLLPDTEGDTLPSGPLAKLGHSSPNPAAPSNTAHPNSQEPRHAAATRRQPRIASVCRNWSPAGLQSRLPLAGDGRTGEAPSALLEVREAPCEREIDSSKKLPPGRTSPLGAPAKCLQRDSCGGTKPFSSTLRPKIWAPCGDPAPATTLPGTGAVPPVQAGGPGEPLLLAPLPGRPGLPDARDTWGPPATGARLEGTKGAEDSPSSGVGPRRRLASAARPPGHMARSPAEDQRGFVASEQGASQSAGRGRRACDGFRRENWLRGAGPGEPGGGRAEGRGSSCSPGSPRVRGVYYPCTRSAKEQGSQAGLSPRRESDTVPREERQEGERERLTWTDSQAALQESVSAQPHSLLPAQPLPGCWVVPRI